MARSNEVHAGVPAADGRVGRGGRSSGELAKEFGCTAWTIGHVGQAGGAGCGPRGWRPDERRARGADAAAA